MCAGGCPTSEVEISDRFVTQPGGVDTTVKKFEGTDSTSQEDVNSVRVGDKEETGKQIIISEQD